MRPRARLGSAGVRLGPLRDAVPGPSAARDRRHHLGRIPILRTASRRSSPPRSPAACRPIARRVPRRAGLAPGLDRRRGRAHGKTTTAAMIALSRPARSRSRVPDRRGGAAAGLECPSRLRLARRRGRRVGSDDRAPSPQRSPSSRTSTSTTTPEFASKSRWELFERWLEEVPRRFGATRRAVRRRAHHPAGTAKPAASSARRARARRRRRARGVAGAARVRGAGRRWRRSASPAATCGSWTTTRHPAEIRATLAALREGIGRILPSSSRTSTPEPGISRARRRQRWPRPTSSR